MKTLLVTCVILAFSSSLFADQPDTPTATSLTESYYEAWKAGNKEAAWEKIEELQRQFPDSALTNLALEHWVAKPNEQKTPRPLPKEVVNRAIVKVYNVADLVVPIPGENNRRANKTHLRDLIKLIGEVSKQQNWTKENGNVDATIESHPSTLSIVASLPEPIHAKLENLLRQLRQQQDLQIGYELGIVRVPAKIARTLDVRGQLSEKQKNALITTAGVKVLLTPKITTFDDQLASVSTDKHSVKVHGKVSADRRTIRIEAEMSESSDVESATWSLATSDVIPDGRTGCYFIRTDGADSKMYDPRLLIERGIDVPASDADQLFLMITPQLIIQEEEEELLGVAPKRFPRYAPVTPASYPYTRWIDAKQSWTPVNLEWDDGNWQLDFDTKKMPYGAGAMYFEQKYDIRDLQSPNSPSAPAK